MVDNQAFLNSTSPSFEKERLTTIGWKVATPLGPVMALHIVKKTYCSVAIRHLLGVDFKKLTADNNLHT